MVAEPYPVQRTRRPLDLTGRNIALLVGGLLLLLVILLALTRSSWSTSTLYPVKINGKFGYINRSGKVAIQPQFDDAEEFADGYAPVKLANRWGYVDSGGKLAIAPQFDMADPFSDGRAMVGLGPKLGYIDKTGKFVINP